MPFNGTGLFSRVYQWINDEALGIFVDATRTDTDSNDIAVGLSNCVTRDGQSPWLANLPAAGFKITNLGVGQAAGDAVNYGQVFVNPVFTNASSSATVPITDNSLKYATTAFVVATAFASTLPNQTGNAGKYIKTDGTTAGWAYISMTRIPRASNTIITVGNANTFIDYTAGNFTQTWSSATILGEGFVIRIRNSSQTDNVEMEAPIVNTQTSTTSNSIAAGTTWQISPGLVIGAGDLVNVRRTSDGFNQRIVGVAASYNSGTGALIVTPTYRIGSGTFTDWTITTRPVANGIDGLGSYVMYPNECRDFIVSGSAIISVIVTEFDKTFTTTERFIPPPRYVEFEGVATSGAGGGARSGGTNLAPGGPGGGSMPFRLAASLFGAAQDIFVGAGGTAIVSPATGTSTLSGDTQIGTLLTVQGTTTTAGGAVMNGRGVSSNPEIDFGSNVGVSSRNTLWGGVSPSTDASVNGGSSIYGGPCGGSISSAGTIRLPGTSLNGGVAGAAGDAVNGGNGSGVAAGGGGTRTGTSSGFGTGGQVRMSGRA